MTNSYLTELCARLIPLDSHPECRCRYYSRDLNDWNTYAASYQLAPSVRHGACGTTNTAPYRCRALSS